MCVRKACDEHVDNDKHTDEQHDYHALDYAQLGVSSQTKGRDMHCVSLFLFNSGICGGVYSPGHFFDRRKTRRSVRHHRLYYRKLPAPARRSSGGMAV